MRTGDSYLPVLPRHDSRQRIRARQRRRRGLDRAGRTASEGRGCVAAKGHRPRSDRLPGNRIGDRARHGRRAQFSWRVLRQMTDGAVARFVAMLDRMRPCSAARQQKDGERQPGEQRACTARRSHDEPSTYTRFPGESIGLRPSVVSRCAGNRRAAPRCVRRLPPFPDKVRRLPCGLAFSGPLAAWGGRRCTPWPPASGRH